MRWHDIGCRSVSICRTAKLGAYSCRRCVGRSTLNMLIVHEFVSEFCLSLTQTNRVRVSVYRMNLRKQHDIAGRTYGERNGDNQQEQSDNDTGRRIIKLTDCCDEATVTRSGNSNGLHDQNYHLEKENEEKHHKVEAGIATERLIRWPIPVKLPNLIDSTIIGHSPIRHSQIGRKLHLPAHKRCWCKHERI